MKLFPKLFYLGVLIFSVAFLFIGNRIATDGLVTPDAGDDANMVPAVVTQIIDRVEDQHQISPEFTLTNISITFGARITGGELSGQEITALHNLSTMALIMEKEVEVGDRILLFYDAFNSQYFFANYIRINYILILAIAFLVLMVLFGRLKGFNAIVALGFICLAIFLVFIPAILAGINIYLATIIVCAYAIISTLLIVVGPNKKALSSILGCLGGVLLAGLLVFFMDIILNLTGMIDDETPMLLLLPTENPINLRAIIFAGVTIGAVGAIMDVAMSIASSLWEVKQAGAKADFSSILKSGVNIGKDILGTMLNTLILAYIGSSLSLILLISAHATSLTLLFNTEMVIVELLRALVGSFGILLTIPLTAAICGWLYSQHEAGEAKQHGKYGI